MQDKRYSVFISSTFEDLRKERQAVQDAVLSAGDFPVQMETFPAADQDQFEFIKALIDKCDYYVLIVAGRYGTPTDDGVSYTEKEYHYAISQNIPVLVMLHGDPGSIPASKTEPNDEGKERLERFIEQISAGRLRNSWKDTGELKHAVRDALDNAKATRPGVGWVRGDTTANTELLGEINEVRKENEKFREAIGHLKVELALPPIPAADESVEIELIPVISDSRGCSGTHARIKCTWIDAFSIFSSSLDWVADGYQEKYLCAKEASCSAMGQAFAAEFATFDTEGLYTISPNTFERFMSYYIETGLMVADGEEPFTNAAKRAARRHRIADTGEDKFFIVSGEVSRKHLQKNQAPIDDDEVSF